MGNDDITQAGGGRYEFDRTDSANLLGRGGLAEVWLGHDTVTGRRVAGKFYAFRAEAHEAALEEECRRRFTQEALALETLDHAYIVRLLENASDHPREPHVVLEYGIESLSADLARHGGGFTGINARRRAWALQAAQALAYLHRNEYVHRDLKLSNIVVKDDTGETVRLIDLGFVRLPGGSHTETGRMGCGSPGYVAPEQAINFAAARPPADVYAFGACLWALSTGESPSRLAEAGHLLGPGDASDPRVPPEYARLVAQCLDREPARRPLDGSALVAELARLPQESPADASSIGDTRPKGAVSAPPGGNTPDPNVWLPKPRRMGWMRTLLSRSPSKRFWS